MGNLSRLISYPVLHAICVGITAMTSGTALARTATYMLQGDAILAGTQGVLAGLALACLAASFVLLLLNALVGDPRG